MPSSPAACRRFPAAAPRARWKGACLEACPLVLAPRPRRSVMHRRPPHLVEERSEADAEQPRGLPAVAAGRLEGALDREALDRLDLGLEIERAGAVAVRPVRGA